MKTTPDFAVPFPHHLQDSTALLEMPFFTVRAFLTQKKQMMDQTFPAKYVQYMDLLGLEEILSSKKKRILVDVLSSVEQ